ncbi:MAG: protein kinase domain-containing protein [Myxococcota bacterium]
MERARSQGAPSPVGPGALVGRYVVDGLLLETPRHRVFRGQSLSGARRVEIKVMGARHRLRRLEVGEVGNPYVRELRLATAGYCECIVPHLDAGTTSDGAHYLVREYVDGRTVRNELETRGRLSLPDAAAIVADAATAAHALHRLGYVLRDIRPEVLITRRRAMGEALRDTLVDDVEGSARVGTRGRTRAAGELATDPRCMAPEVAAGGAATPASDVYSLTAVLFELLAGCSVLHGVGDGAAALAWLESGGALPVTSLREHAPDLPMEGDLLVRKGLAREPGSRPGVIPLLRGIGHVLRAWADVHGDDRVPRALWPRLLRPQ